MENRVELIWARQGQMEEGQFMQEHCHACFQMYYVLRGSATFMIGGKALRVHEGDAFVIPEMTAHRMLSLEEDGFSFFETKLYIKDCFLKEHLREPPSPVNDKVTIKKMLAYVVENWTCDDEQNKKDMEYILSTIILNFFIGELHYKNKNSTHILTDGYSNATRAVLVYIENHFAYKFKLEALGNKLNYNKNYLCHIFKKDTGVSIVDYLNFIRIRQAIIFFSFYSQDVYTTSESVGFSNLSHFSRTFKALVGIAPRDFRRAFSKIEEKDIAKYFADEIILNYRPYTMDEAQKSLISIGKRALALLDDTKKVQ